MYWNLTVLCLVGLLAACSAKAPSVQRANPASTHCIQEGGKHVVERGPGGEFGVCQFPDNRLCEEWALLRGQCPKGGVHVAGYLTVAARYCAITGGRYSVTGRSGAADEQGTCTFPNGGTCEADAYYRGTCHAPAGE